MGKMCKFTCDCGDKILIDAPKGIRVKIDFDPDGWAKDVGAHIIKVKQIEHRKKKA